MAFKQFSNTGSRFFQLLGLLLLFLLSTSVLFFSSPSWVNSYDEGLILTGALRVLSGEKPSVDFYVNYGPAQFYIVAWVLELFGRSVTISRMYDALVAAAVLAAAWWVLREAALRWFALVALGVILVLLLLYRSPLYPVTPCLVLIVVGGQFTVQALKGGGPATAFLPVALVIAALTVFRYFIGALGVAAFGTSILVTLSVQVWLGSATFKRAVETVLGAGLLLGLAYAVTLGALYAAGFLEPALDDLLTYVVGNYSEMRALPFPDLAAIRAHPLDNGVIYLPPAACLLGLLSCLFSSNIRKGVLGNKLEVVCVFTTLTIFLYSQALVRTDSPHVLISAVPAIIVVFIFLDDIEKRICAPLPQSVRVRIQAIALVVVSLFAGYGLYATGKRSVFVYHLGDAAKHPGIPAAGLFRTRPELADAARYVLETTEPGERILSATGRHDKVFINDISFYFLVQRLPGTRWHQYDPGIQTTAEVQGQMIRELEANAVSVVVRDTTWDEITEPNKSAESSGVTLLDDYLDRNYRKVRDYGRITVYRRVD